jgi:SAM-dependent methyltransferase
MLEGLARRVRRKPPRRALDLCCGTGAVLDVLAPLATEIAVGLDFSSGMLRIARGSSSRALVRADALAPPFDRSFDLVTCFSALGHFLPREHRHLVGAVRGCLVEGGSFLLATGRMPPLRSRRYWLSRLFNAAMHVRNTVWSPPFIMYYLTFLLPEARAILVDEGFEVDVVERAFAPPFEEFVLVDATKYMNSETR